MRKFSGKLVYSPSDLITYLKSPFASWMEHYYLENRDKIKPDEATEDEKLIAEMGNKHELEMLNEFRGKTNVAEIPKEDINVSRLKTLESIAAKAPIIFQAYLEDSEFAGYADFLILDEYGQYQIWDTKLARAPKPYYAIQLCCYSEMFAGSTGNKIPEKFGIILGSKDSVEFRVEDFIHYYKRVKAGFLAMHNGFTGEMTDCPEPLPGADHGRWTSYAEKYFEETDSLFGVAGITVGQIKKLKKAGITTMEELSKVSGKSVNKLSNDTLAKLISQARLQCQTREARKKEPDAIAVYEVISKSTPNEGRIGLESLPAANMADVFFDMEGYPLISGGLEYLFGVCSTGDKHGSYEFHDWWAHDRDEEKLAFEGFIDWTFDRWKKNPGMHIYHYAAYEVSAIRRLSTRHDTRQDEVDELLRNEVFVDLYRVVRHSLRIGERSYSIKVVEQLYRPKRSTDVANAVDSIVQYARWIESGESPRWKENAILKNIRDYNEDDCKSTLELLIWLRKVAAENGITIPSAAPITITGQTLPKELSPEVIARLEVIQNLRKQADYASLVLADLVDFHRREEKPMWWRMFDRTKATSEELHDDASCIEGLQVVGAPATEKQSLVQTYQFDPAQECKLSSDSTVMFAHNLDAKFTLLELDTINGELKLKISKRTLTEKLGGNFPRSGSLIPYEYISAKQIQLALTEIAIKHVDKNTHESIASLIGRSAPASRLQEESETVIDSAIRITSLMSGGCLVIQGPPGTGKTYTASHVINALLSAGKRVGVASNSHKAVVNLMTACGETARKSGRSLLGIKVGGDGEGPLFSDNPSLGYVKDTGDAYNAYSSGIIGGTAWLFTRPEWEGALDFLFIDEAGQVSLANTVGMARSAKNLVLLGDQMQLEQPVQGTHPGDAGLSSLQYALKDLKTSKQDLPVFHAVVPSDYGLFLGESRRMHPSVCRFISESIYEGRLGSHASCSNQKISVPSGSNKIVAKEHGIVFSGVEHDGNIQQSDEEIERVKAIYDEMLGRPYTDTEGKARNLGLEDFLFIAPYNAQVRALKSVLPEGARVGSVDKFQGQEAPVCILSLCSSYGEYGSRGLAFILDQNRINVAISRAQCVAIVVADPRIATATATSIDEMMLLNVFAKIVDSN